MHNIDERTTVQVSLAEEVHELLETTFGIRLNDRGLRLQAPDPARAGAGVDFAVVLTPVAKQLGGSPQELAKKAAEGISSSARRRFVHRADAHGIYLNLYLERQRYYRRLLAELDPAEPYWRPREAVGRVVVIRCRPTSRAVGRPASEGPGWADNLARLYEATGAVTHWQPFLGHPLDAEALVADQLAQDLAHADPYGLTDAVFVRRQGERAPYLLRTPDGVATEIATALASLRACVHRHAPDEVVYISDQEQPWLPEVFRLAEKAGYATRDDGHEVVLRSVTTDSSGGTPRAVPSGRDLCQSQRLDRVQKALLTVTQALVSTGVNGAAERPVHCKYEHATEFALAQTLADYPIAVRSARERENTQVLFAYLDRLVLALDRCRRVVPGSSSDDRDLFLSRRWLLACAAHVLFHAGRVLGIAAPEARS